MSSMLLTAVLLLLSLFSSTALDNSTKLGECIAYTQVSLVKILQNSTIIGVNGSGCSSTTVLPPVLRQELQSFAACVGIRTLARVGPSLLTRALSCSSRVSAEFSLRIAS